MAPGIISQQLLSGTFALCCKLTILLSASTSLSRVFWLDRKCRRDSSWQLDIVNS